MLKRTPPIPRWKPIAVLIATASVLLAVLGTSASAAAPYTLEQGSAMSFTSPTGTMGPFVLDEDCIGFIEGGSPSCGTFEDGPGFFEIELAADTSYGAAANEISASNIAVSINGPCTVELNDTYTLSHAGGNSWTTQDEIGSYTLSSCSPAEASVIVGNLGPSPSTGVFAADWIIDVS